MRWNAEPKLRLTGVKAFGNRYTRSHLKQYELPDTAPDAPGQLYNLDTDPGETKNLYNKHPEIVKALKAKLEHYKSAGRSRP